MAEPLIRTVILETPIALGGAPAVTELQLRKPSAGELRGLSLAKLGQVDVDELLKLLPRIATPVLTMAEAGALDLPDIMEIADVVTDFLLSKARRETLSPTA